MLYLFTEIISLLRICVNFHIEYSCNASPLEKFRANKILL